MPLITTKCPHCNAELDAQENWVGMEVECPACQKSFTVEKNIPPKLELQPIQTNVQQSSENTKNCPFCGGVIKEKAIFCKHCKADLNKNDVSEKSIESSFIFICSECNTAVELPESMKGKEYECQGCCETSIAKETLERDCPLCGEKIKIKATLCKHCRQQVTPLLNHGVPASGGIENKSFPTLSAVDRSNRKSSSICKHTDMSSLWVSILLGLSIIAWIVSIIGIFVDGILWLVCFILAFIFSALSLLLKKDESLEMYDNEVILATCRMRDKDNLCYYVRMTNRRLIFSAIEYPWLPCFVAIVIELCAKPKRVTYAWAWNEIISISRESRKIMGINTYYDLIRDSENEYTFTKNEKLENFWNCRQWEL